jgi:hypothetical protein
VPSEVLRWRVKSAERLFLTLRDVVPLMVLTGRNVETLKELPVPPLLQHRLRDRRQAITYFLANNQPAEPA